ncbi:MAG TPA: hypothetical protein PKD49_13680 [Hyphomicrobium sp.]|mgnify:FL=1|nr:hypothetical protein [Hyphomicrobium sp.]
MDPSQGIDFETVLERLAQQATYGGISRICCHGALGRLNERLPSAPSSPIPLYDDAPPTQLEKQTERMALSSRDFLAAHATLSRHRGDLAALRALRRRLAPRLHPHAVAPEFAAEAQDFFKQLNSAIDDARRTTS